MGYIITSWYKGYIVSLDICIVSLIREPDSWLYTLYGDCKFLVLYIVISRNFLYDGGAFEHIFCPGGGEFEKPDFKKFKPPASAWGGDVEVSIELIGT